MEQSAGATVSTSRLSLVEAEEPLKFRHGACRCPAENFSMTKLLQEC